MDVKRRRGLSLSANFRSWCLAPHPYAHSSHCWWNASFWWFFHSLDGGRLIVFLVFPAGSCVPLSLSLSHTHILSRELPCQFWDYILLWAVVVIFWFFSIRFHLQMKFFGAVRRASMFLQLSNPLLSRTPLVSCSLCGRSEWVEILSLPL